MEINGKKEQKLDLFYFMSSCFSFKLNSSLPVDAVASVSAVLCLTSTETNVNLMFELK